MFAASATLYSIMRKMEWADEHGTCSVEIGEAVSVLMSVAAPDDLCQGVNEPELEGHKSRIGKVGEETNVSAERLNRNMKNAGVTLPGDPPKAKTKKGKKSAWWDLEGCNAGKFPYQSHHLIPKMHLPKHAVCQFLAVKAGKQKWKLEKSTNYDTDSELNGLALPFASNTYQYKTAKNPAAKQDVCNEMMKITQRQLHQGSHTNTDYLEQAGLHAKEKTGYLGRVDELLNVVNAQALFHYRYCTPCKKEPSDPQKIRPLERVVEATYEVSAIIATMIVERNIFVSKRAALYVASGGLGGLG